MRTIKFRGKKISNGKWVYGGFAQYFGKCFIVVMERYIPDTRDSDMADYYEKHPAFRMTHIEVIPETVGQFTGLTDKNDKEIYEGDIVWHKLQGKRVVYYPFNKDTASYGIIHENGMCSMLCDASNLYEVIGNIHDNPELLK